MTENEKNKRAAFSELDVDFGFTKMSPQKKTESVKNVFESVAPRYDIMNDVMSFGFHRIWKKWFVDSLPIGHHYRCLDVAGGTGDIAGSLIKRFSQQNIEGQFMICDMNQEMIREGISKQKNSPISWVCGSAEQLPLLSQSIDLYTISFGLRNVTFMNEALSEAYRVLRKGGVFACLEFSHVIPPLKKVYDFYSFNLIPFLGEKIARDRESYQYLAESIRKFPTQKQLASLLENTGFSKIKITSYSAGVVAVHMAYKL